MPVHSVASFIENTAGSSIGLLALSVISLGALKVWSGGRSNTRERDWGGKYILVVALPTPTTLSLLHHLSHLSHPPIIIYLPPLPSPLPQSLLTLLTALRLTLPPGKENLYVEALPPTPRGVRDFVKNWEKVQYGLQAENGRPIDAIILGDGWGLEKLDPKLKDNTEDPDWTTHQFHFHLITALLPHLLRAPADRNIRIINLISPGWASAIPALQGVTKKASRLQESGKEGIKSLLLMAQFQRILDTLASATYGRNKTVPVPNPDGKVVKQRDETVQSNIMALSVVMGWARDEVVRPLGADWMWSLWILFYPLIIIFTPSPSKSIQSILFALSAPVRYGPIDDSPLAKHGASPDGGKPKIEGGLDVRRNMVAGGDVVRDCGVVDMPPILSDPFLARETYDKIEKEVEKGVRESAIRGEAYPPIPPTAEVDETQED